MFEPLSLNEEAGRDHPEVPLTRKADRKHGVSDLVSAELCSLGAACWRVHEDKGEMCVRAHVCARVWLKPSLQVVLRISGGI